MRRAVPGTPQHLSNQRCQGCGRRATFRIYMPSAVFEFRCDSCARRRVQDFYDRHGLMLNVHPLRAEGAVGGGVGGFL